MGEPDKQERKALATTEIESEEEAAARRLPTPVLLEDGEEDGPDPLLGRVLGGLYKVESRIGEGGMGTVYCAIHVHLNKQFAVKVLSRKIAQHKQAVERLRQEAQAASNIDHDNIIDVVNFDTTEDGDVFIVMELLRGISLADLLERGRLELPKALLIAYQIARALHAAHDRGIIHRDLKPENVFVVRKADTDFVKVLDFGISKVKTAETEQVRMTKTGQLVGTPLYMSPEQAKGEADVDRRADIYALGVILYEMLTGTPPFEGSNYFQLLWKHGNEEPERPGQRCPEAKIPPAVEDVVMRTLAKDPEERFQSMAELEEALAAAAPDMGLPGGHFVSLSPTPVGVARRSRPTEAGDRSRLPLMLGGVALVAALAVGGAFALGGDEGNAAETGETLAVDGPPRDEPTGEPGPEDRDGNEDADEGGPSAGDTAEDHMPTGVEPPADPPTVTVRFESRPPGATVTVDGEALGETPMVAPVPESDDPVEVRFEKRGHRDDVVSVAPSEGTVVRGRLRRVQRGETGRNDSIPIMMW